MAEAPLHVVALPLITAVGTGLTVTTALPENVPVQLASLTAVTVYVVVTVGATLNVYGDVATAFTVTGVVPSV